MMRTARNAARCSRSLAVYLGKSASGDWQWPGFCCLLSRPDPWIRTDSCLGLDRDGFTENDVRVRRDLPLAPRGHCRPRLVRGPRIVSARRKQLLVAALAGRPTRLRGLSRRAAAPRRTGAFVPGHGCPALQAACRRDRCGRLGALWSGCVGADDLLAELALDGRYLGFRFPAPVGDYGPGQLRRVGRLISGGCCVRLDDR